MNHWLQRRLDKELTFDFQVMGHTKAMPVVPHNLNKQTWAHPLWSNGWRFESAGPEMYS
jgi:hypothetical protein